MGWISHRKTAEWATKMTSQLADMFEQETGRAPTAKELRELNEQAKETARKADDRNRRNAEGL